MMELKETYKILEAFANYIVNTYKSKISEYSDGALYRTINFNISKGNDLYTVTINLEDYYKYIELGRKAGAKFPPISAIEKWIEYRKIIPRPITLKSGKTTIPTVKQLSYLIARSISENGIKARPYMSTTIEEAQKLFIDKLKIAVYNDIVGIFDNINN